MNVFTVCPHCGHGQGRAPNALAWTCEGCHVTIVLDEAPEETVPPLEEEDDDEDI